MKMYEFYMSTAGNSSISAILEDIHIWENGVAKATKVAEAAGFNEDGSIIYRRCQPREFIAGGGPYTLQEYLGSIEPSKREEEFDRVKRSIPQLE